MDDTIKWITIPKQLELCVCTEDEARFVHLFLWDTKLCNRVNQASSDEFQSFLGAQQGDCLSGCQITKVLAAVLIELKWTIIMDLNLKDAISPGAHQDYIFPSYTSDIVCAANKSVRSQTVNI